jgi:hypothetical protein
MTILDFPPFWFYLGCGRQGLAAPPDLVPQVVVFDIID